MNPGSVPTSIQSGTVDTHSYTYQSGRVLLVVVFIIIVLVLIVLVFSIANLFTKLLESFLR
jgi:hypothetical protein